MSFGRNVFSDFFDDDPFERMDRMMNSMDSMFDSSLFGAPRPVRRLQEQSRRPRGYRQEPIIEEVDDYVDQRGSRSSDPIVEEPEEDGAYNAYPSQSHANHYGAQSYGNNLHSGYYNNNRQRSGQHHNGGSAGVRINIGSNGIPEVSQFGNGVRTMFSYTSSHSMSQGNGAPQPVVYSSSSTTRIGPGGVRETTSTVRDGMTGQESVTVSRAIGERGRTITRTRDARGHEESRDILNNLSENETASFDQEWAQHAGRSLPSAPGNMSGRSRHGGRHPRIGY